MLSMHLAFYSHTNPWYAVDLVLRCDKIIRISIHFQQHVNRGLTNFQKTGIHNRKNEKRNGGGFAGQQQDILTW